MPVASPAKIFSRRSGLQPDFDLVDETAGALVLSMILEHHESFLRRSSARHAAAIDGGNPKIIKAGLSMFLGAKRFQPFYLGVGQPI